MELILKYFPDLSELQKEQFSRLDLLYREWNAQINVISRKDIEQLYLHHVLHSLAIAKYVKFYPGAEILDIGTGGGFPGIPLAIFYPETKFLLIDGTAKKIKVVQEVAQALNLKNVTARQVRAEELKGQKFDFVLSRGVTTLDKLFDWTGRVLKSKQQHALPNGLIALKGGNLKEEIKALPKGSFVEKTPISNYFREDFFEEKFVVYVQG
ncbi:MAG TPA: 16S rRNA (guanine(527)-N(7))-methyltransferase RsmG [Saprospiraceae bacterium]|nr:16S rRNA (guanine(527)-N(7))-methyltransferase RsmG [Saprospiraceae bacterium]